MLLVVLQRWFCLLFFLCVQLLGVGGSACLVESTA